MSSDHNQTRVAQSQPSSTASLVHNKSRPKNPKSILSTRQTGLIRVFHDGKDLTPEPLFHEGMKEKQPSVYEIAGIAGPEQSVTDVKLFQSQSVSRFHTELHRQTVQAESLFCQSFISSGYGDDVVIEPDEGATISDSILDESASDFSDAPLRIPVYFKPMPSHISLILSETPTFFLLDLPSKTVDKDDEEAIKIEAENARYEYLTEGKGRNRKMVTTEAQTTFILQKTRTTGADRPKRRHHQTFASNWEMYDTYVKAFEIEAVVHREFLEDERDLVDSAEAANQQQILDADAQMRKLIENNKFLEACCVTERLLANNNFNEQQKRFRGLSDPNPFREDIEYKYRLDLLWTFANKETSGRCVTAICWNDANSDIVTVAYGKFYYADRTTGMVMLWNIKNPVQPERVYRFDQPVTAICFSKKNPNILGIGFYDGSIKLIDVSSRELRVIGKSASDSPSFEPIWQITFFQSSKYFKDEEQIITTGQDGRISYFRAQDTVELIYSQIMRISRPEGKLKGIQTLRRCHVPGIPVTRYASALVITQHPMDLNIYYVGTSIGTIHKCSRNYNHQHLDMFLAHDGPLYVMKFSPFCNKLLLTCGDDWNVRVWADGIVEHLFELSKSMQSVQGADWSPTHSTIIANITGTEISIWDVQRKTYKPQSVTVSPTSCRNTVVQFTASGRCLVVGDIEGNVHVFALEDMPFPAFFQDDLLINSIIRNLVTRPDLINQLKKLGSLNYKPKSE